MERNKSESIISKVEAFFEVSWDTVSSYLKERYETPIPMHGTDACVLLVKPCASVELQMRTKEAFKTELSRLPQLSRFRYEHATTQSYEYLSIVCDYSEFDETVLKFFCSIASNFVLEKLTAEKSITCAYIQWKEMLAQLRLPDEFTLAGIWGELFVINLLLENREISPMCLIQNWTGPLGYANDFSFGSSAIEVKTTTKQSNIVEISSMDQLDAKQAWIILLRVLHRPVQSGGVTIFSLVDKIKSRLDSAALDLFINRIDRVIDTSTLHNLDSFSLINAGATSAVLIDNSFPVLTRTNITKLFDEVLVSKLSNVKYSLNLSDKLSDGITDIQGLFKKLSLG